MSDRLPYDLAPWRGRLDGRLCEGAVAGLGDCAGPARALLARGLVPPDVLTGMTLHLLANQPRRPNPDGTKKKGAIEGGVWVREQITHHAPVRLDEEVRISGASSRRFSRKGRRYGVNVSETRAGDGRRLVTSCTTGLLSYRKDPDLADGEEGVAESALPVAGVDPAASTSNPARERLAAVAVGDVVGAGPTAVSLEMMRLRDAGRDDNRIHTDPEVARREGLAAPIAGGSHVLAFLQVALMAAWGSECLLHGAHFDVRWVGQTRAGDAIRSRATVIEATPSLLRCELEILGDERPVLSGTLLLPRSTA